MQICVNNVLSVNEHCSSVITLQSGLVDLSFSSALAENASLAGGVAMEMVTVKTYQMRKIAVSTCLVCSWFSKEH